jgi:hypothetical protein
VVPVITLEEAERRIRREIDEYLDSQARPEETLGESLRQQVRAAAAEDHLGLWWIVRIIGDQWPRVSEDSLRRFVLSLLGEELAAGTLIAGFPTKTGGFMRWTGRPEEIVHEVDRRWKVLGRRPNIGEVVWLTTPESNQKVSLQGFPILTTDELLARLRAPERAAARRVADDLSWPAGIVQNVIEQLADMELAVLGLEAWEFPAGGGGPQVRGVTDYRVDIRKSWRDVVADARRQALASLAELPDVSWINVTWADRERVAKE